MPNGGTNMSGPNGADSLVQQGFEAALRELQHQAQHLEQRGALRAAVTLYDAIRITRSGGLTCIEHRAAR